MKKSVVILIAIIYIASIALVSFFGLQLKSFDEIIYSTGIDLLNEDIKLDKNGNNYALAEKGEDGIWRFAKHPDTGVEWSRSSLPNWAQVKEQILRVCDHVSSLDYLGLDVIITQDGMKLCEINSHPAMDYEQIMCGPTLAKPAIRAFFENKGMFRYDGEDLYQAYLESQE